MDEKYPGKAQPVLVQKASGELQPFDSKKLGKNNPAYPLKHRREQIGLFHRNRI